MYERCKGYKQKTSKTCSGSRDLLRANYFSLLIVRGIMKQEGQTLDFIDMRCFKEYLQGDEVRLSEKQKREWRRFDTREKIIKRVGKKFLKWF